MTKTYSRSRVSSTAVAMARMRGLTLLNENDMPNASTIEMMALAARVAFGIE